MSLRRAFTLIELLVVIAIIAILAVVVVLVLNPAELLKQSRDANRVSDVNTLTSALSLKNIDSASPGTPDVLYLSLPDPTIPAGATSTCSGIGLSSSSLPQGWTYQCASVADYRNTNGSGWIPVNFASGTVGNALSALPVDPVNQSSSGLYYTYTTNGGSQFEISANFESQKYASVAANSGGPYNDLYVKGSSLSLLPIDYRPGHIGVQQACGAGGVYSSSITCTFPSPVIPGDVLLAAVSGSSATSSPIISGCGVTWTALGTTTDGFGLWYAPIGSGASSSCAAMFVESGGGDWIGTVGEEITGVKPVVDAYTVLGSGSICPCATPTATTTVNGDFVATLLLANGHNDPGGTTVASPFTLAVNAPGVNGGGAAYAIQSSAGPISATFTTINTIWGVTLGTVAFEP